MTTTLTIPATWTQSAGCLASNDLYGWEDSTGYFVDALGAPSQTSSCYPPGYEATSGFMYATACPQGFTSAGADADNDQLTVCCPTAYKFSSGTVSIESNTLFCASQWTAETSITFTWLIFESDGSTATEYTVTSTDDDDSETTTYQTTLKIATEYRETDRAMNAMGIKISSTSAVSTSTTASGSTSSAAVRTSTSTPATATATASTSTSSSGLSPGAAAGIGIGSAIGVILVVLGIWFVYRRGVKKGQSAGKIEEAGRKDEKQPSTTEMDATVYPRELEDNTPKSYTSYNYEMPTDAQRHELDNKASSRVELP